MWKGGRRSPNATGNQRKPKPKNQMKTPTPKIPISDTRAYAIRVAAHAQIAAEAGIVLSQDEVDQIIAAEWGDMTGGQWTTVLCRCIQRHNHNHPSHSAMG